MQSTLRVQRYDPEAPDSTPHFQEYELETEEHFTVLDALIKVREEVDPSLALRCSCRAAICGSCAMRVNGHAKLACKTRLVSVAPHGEAVTVEPMGNTAVVKDLVVDAQPFWQKVRAVAPYLQPEGPEPEDEYLAPNEAMVKLIGVMGCIMCGACVSDCTALEVDQNFLGPAALAKAFRFVEDPRDAADQERLRSLGEYGGVWDCTRCYECVEVCPKGVAPMDRIMELRERAMASGVAATSDQARYGSRHVNAFAESVSHTGWLDELRLPIKTWGIFNLGKLVPSLPVAIRAVLRGKLPPIWHKKRPGAANVGRIFRRTEGGR